MSKVPYKIRSFQIVNGERLIDTGDGTFLLKPHQDLDSTFSFLENHRIPFFARQVHTDERYDVYPYEVQKVLDPRSKRRDLSVVLASIHKNTCFYKEKDMHRIETFYETYSKKIEELTAYYDSMNDELEGYLFPTPAMQYYLRHSSMIFFHLSLAQELLRDWYQMAQDIPHERWVFCNRACTLDSYLQGKCDVLLDWSKAKFASPLEDLVILLTGQDDYYSLLRTYESIFELTPFERLELWIIGLLPDEIRFRRSLKADYANFLKIQQMYQRMESFYHAYSEYQKK